MPTYVLKQMGGLRFYRFSSTKKDDIERSVAFLADEFEADPDECTKQGIDVVSEGDPSVQVFREVIVA